MIGKLHRFRIPADYLKQKAAQLNANLPAEGTVMMKVSDLREMMEALIEAGEAIIDFGEDAALSVRDAQAGRPS